MHKYILLHSLTSVHMILYSVTQEPVVIVASMNDNSQITSNMSKTKKKRKNVRSLSPPSPMTPMTPMSPEQSYSDHDNLVIVPPSEDVTPYVDTNHTDQEPNMQVLMDVCDCVLLSS